MPEMLSLEQLAQQYGRKIPNWPMMTEAEAQTERIKRADSVGLQDPIAATVASLAQLTPLGMLGEKILPVVGKPSVGGAMDALRAIGDPMQSLAVGPVGRVARQFQVFDETAKADLVSRLKEYTDKTANAMRSGLPPGLDADELAQRSLAHAWSKIDRVPGEVDPGKYLGESARRHMNDVISEHLAELSKTRNQIADPTKIGQGAQATAVLKQDPLLERAVEMRLKTGLGRNDIASALGIPRQDVYKSLPDEVKYVNKRAVRVPATPATEKIPASMLVPKRVGSKWVVSNPANPKEAPITFNTAAQAAEFGKQRLSAAIESVMANVPKYSYLSTSGPLLRDVFLNNISPKQASKKYLFRDATPRQKQMFAQRLEMGTEEIMKFLRNNPPKR